MRIGFIAAFTTILAGLAFSVTPAHAVRSLNPEPTWQERAQEALKGYATWSAAGNQWSASCWATSSSRRVCIIQEETCTFAEDEETGQPLCGVLTYRVSARRRPCGILVVDALADYHHCSRR